MHYRTLLLGNLAMFRSVWKPLLAVNLAATIFTSAFLLFQVQPIISKYILPWFGGSPAVWTTCMVFFQCVLFGGYLYAHALSKLRSVTAQMLVHVALLLVALSLLPITPDDAWKPNSAEQPTWHILCLLAVSVGLPFFMLATTGPLIQAWFSRTLTGQSPYRLYALSNVGSLAALLTYPFWVEPALDLDQQAGWWSTGFVAFAILCAVAAIVVSLVTRGGTRTASEPATPQATAAAPPQLQHALAWLGFAAFASFMLLATTNHVCQDVAVIPFLWVVPLALYLLSFIIAFDHPRWYLRRMFALSAVGLLCAVALVDQLITTGSGVAFSFVQEVSLYFAALFAVCMVCHGELARLKPHPQHLTFYYLVISAGGAIGGLFVSLLAPVLFHTYLEWKIGLLVGVVLASLVAMAAYEQLRPAQLRRMAMFAPLLLLLFVGINCAPAILGTHNGIVDVQTRSFYGTANVVERDVADPAQHKMLMYSGRIVHGVQFAAAEKRDQPNAYFGPQSGVGRIFTLLQNQPNARVGVIGLGAGTMAAYCQPGQYFRFYEVNPRMQELAEEYFSYLSDCKGICDVVMGDGRLSLEREAPQQFDLLVLDAFSGDAVPTHLLTREAMDAYLRHLTPNGSLAFNISNRYLNLVPVVKRLAEHGGFTALHVSSKGDSAAWQFPAEWMLLVRDEPTLAALKPYAHDDAEDKQFALWTDHYSNLFEILK
jgi:protein-L-isoaspartate O-methyltransferase/lipoprotein signal peptidase